MEQIPSGDLQELQQKRLQKQLRWAAEKCSHYREVFAEQGVSDPARVKLKAPEVLQGLPLLQPWQLLQSPPQPQLQRDFPAFLLRIRERIMNPIPIKRIAATIIVPIFAWIQENISRPLLSYAWAEALAGLNS